MLKLCKTGRPSAKHPTVENTAVSLPCYVWGIPQSVWFRRYIRTLLKASLGKRRKHFLCLLENYVKGNKMYKSLICMFYIFLSSLFSSTWYEIFCLGLVSTKNVSFVLPFLPPSPPPTPPWNCIFYWKVTLG